MAADTITIDQETRRTILLTSMLGRMDRIEAQEAVIALMLAALNCGVDPGEFSKSLDLVLAEMGK